MDFYNKMSKEWNYKNFRDILKTEKKSADSLQALTEMYHELFTIRGLILNLIGYMGEIKI